MTGAYRQSHIVHVHDDYTLYMYMHVYDSTSHLCVQTSDLHKRDPFHIDNNSR